MYVEESATGIQAVNWKKIWVWFFPLQILSSLWKDPVNSLRFPLLSHQYNFISQLIKIPARWLVRSPFETPSRLAHFSVLSLFNAPSHQNIERRYISNICNLHYKYIRALHICNILVATFYIYIYICDKIEYGFS